MSTRQKIILFVLVLGISIGLQAAVGEPEVEWEQTYSFSEIGYDVCHKVIEVEDGYFLAGYGGREQLDTGIDIDFSLVKINTDGELVWQYFYDHTDDEFEPQRAYDVTKSQDGGFILAGHTNRHSTGTKFFIVKTDKNGLKQWEKLIGTQTRPGKVLGIESTFDGGFIITGNKSFPNLLTEDMQVFKFDMNGELEWEKTYDYEGWKEFGHAGHQTADSGYIFVGHIIYGGSGAILIKTDSSGVVIWKNVYNHMHGGGKYYDVQETPDGGFIIAGYAQPYEVPGVEDGTKAWIIKVDANGNEEWNRDYPYPGKESVFYDVKVLDDGGYVIGGCRGEDVSGQSSAWIIRTDADGNIFWEKEFPSTYSNRIYSIELTSDNGFLLAGSDVYALTSSVMKISKLSAETDVPGEFEVKYFGEVKTPTIGNYQLKHSIISKYEAVADVNHFEILRDAELIYTEPAINPNGIHTYEFTDCDVTVNGLYDYDLIAYNTSNEIVTEKNLTIEILEDQDFKTELSADVVDGLVTLTWKSNWEANCVTGGFNYWEVRRIKKPGGITDETVLGQLDAINPDGIHTYQFEDRPEAGAYEYNLLVTPDGVCYSLIASVSVVVEGGSAVEDEALTPIRTQLGNNYPNPFNPVTTISYSIPNPGYVTLKIYDVLGREIQTLVSEFQQAGSYSLNFDASEFSSGIYFYQLEAGNLVVTKKMVLII